MIAMDPSVAERSFACYQGRTGWVVDVLKLGFRQMRQVWRWDHLFTL